jgi:hypothetical protein
VVQVAEGHGAVPRGGQEARVVPHEAGVGVPERGVAAQLGADEPVDVGADLVDVLPAGGDDERHHPRLVHAEQVAHGALAVPGVLAARHPRGDDGAAARAHPGEHGRRRPGERRPERDVDRVAVDVHVVVGDAAAGVLHELRRHRAPRGEGVHRGVGVPADGLRHRAEQQTGHRRGGDLDHEDHRSPIGAAQRDQWSTIALRRHPFGAA